VKILLVKLREPVVNPPVVPSLGLWGLRAIAKMVDSTNQITILDEGKNPDSLEDTLKNGDFDVVGISGMFAVQHFEFIKNIAIAKSYGKKVIVGGIHATNVARNYPDLIDDICIGEGENWFAKFLGFDKILAINEYPNPYAESLRLEMKSYWSIKRPFGLTSITDNWVPFETSRGCPRSCDFCIVPEYWGGWRPIGLEKVNDRMSFLADKGIQEVFISDDNMSANKQYFLSIMERFRYYEFYWSTPNGFSAKTVLDDNCFKAISRTNCWQLQVAFDATTNKSADLIDMKSKFVEYEDAMKITNRLRDAGIKSVGFFLIGYPGQTLKDMQNTLDFANALPLDNRHIHIATPYPGTDLFRDCIKNGWLNCDPHEIYSKFIGNKSYQISIIQTPEFTPEQVVELRAKDREAALKRKGLL